MKKNLKYAALKNQFVQIVKWQVQRSLMFIICSYYSNLVVFNGA